MRKITFLFLLLSFAVSLCPPAYAQLDNEVMNESACGLNFIQRSIKITDRSSDLDLPGNTMPVTFSITGLPSRCYEIEAAYLWWIVSYRSGSSETPTATVVNPSGDSFDFAATMTGRKGNKCWSEVGTRGFRANVADAITGNGMYQFSVSTDQWETDGLTLMIIYRDYQAAYEGHFVIRDGLITKGNGNTSQTLDGFDACDNSTEATAFMIVSDIQRSVGSSVVFRLNGTAHTYSRDFWNSEFESTSVSDGQTSSDFGITGGNDCYSWVMMGLYYQTTTCTDCPIELQLNAEASADTVCSGNPVALSAFNADSYEWTSIPFGFESNNQFPTDNPTQDMVYYVRGETSDGCFTAYDTVRVYVRENPDIDAGEDIDVCDGNSVQIGNNASGGQPPYTYSWSPAADLSDPNIAQPDVTPTQTRTYKVTVTDANGCENMDQVLVTLLDNPELNLGRDIEICYGSSITIGGQASAGQSPYTYEWTPVTDLSDPNIAQPEASPESTTEYTVTVTDANGCVTTDNITIVVNPLPEPEAGDDVDICFGETTTIGQQAGGGSGPYTYSWNPVTGLSANDQAVVDANPTDSTLYYQTVTDANGCVNVDSVWVNVMPLPEPVIVPDGPLRFCVCDSVTLDAGPDFVSYLWSTSETTRMINVRDEGEYYVTVIDTNGCENTSESVFTSIIYPSSTVELNENTVTAEPGQNVEIPLRLTASDKLDSCHAQHFTAVISYNRSLLVPKGSTPDGEIDGNTRRLTITGLRSGDDPLLATMTFLATLGNAEMTDIDLESFVWNDCMFDVDLVDSDFALTGLCNSGGTTRLITSGPGYALVAWPNPSEGETEINYYVPEETEVDMNLHDVLGKAVKTIIRGKAPKGWNTVSLDVSDLNTGTYFIIMKTHNEAATTIMEVK